MRRWATSLLALAVLCFGGVQVGLGEQVAGQETAQIYYCAEIDSNGFYFNKEKGLYLKTEFITKKFKIKYNSSSNLISLKHEDGKTEDYTCKLPFKFEPTFMRCHEDVRDFNFNTENGRFVYFKGFGYVGGDRDSVIISYGKCDAF